MASERDKIIDRIDQLLKTGDQIISYKESNRNYLSDNLITRCQAWLNSTVNLIRQIAPPTSQLVEECTRLMNSDLIKTHIHYTIVLKMQGLLKSFKEEFSLGLIQQIEYLYAAESFDQFLDHAQNYYENKKKTESSVLASAVLEDTLKKIGKKYIIDTEGKTIEPLVDEMVKKGIFTSVKAKRIKSWAGVRNKALHAEWDQFDLEDVGSMIKGIRELIDTQLQF